MSDDKLHKFTGKSLPSNQTPKNSLPYPASRLAPGIELVDIAREIATANNMLHQHTSSKLKLIAQQIKALQAQAQRILSEAKQDQALHQAECNFKKQPGRIYHLYQRAGGRRYFSIMSPEDWGNSPPHEWLGGYRLEADMSWTPLQTIEEEEDYLQQITELLPEQERF